MSSGLRWAGLGLLLCASVTRAMVCMLPVETGGQVVEQAWFSTRGPLLRTADDRLLHQTAPTTNTQAPLAFEEIRAAGAPIRARQVFATGQGPLIHTYDPVGEDRHALYLYPQMLEPLRNLDGGEVAFHRDGERTWVLTRAGVFRLEAGELQQLQGLGDAPYPKLFMFGGGERLYISVAGDSGESLLYRVEGGAAAPVADWSGELVVGARDLGERGLFLWTRRAIYRAQGPGLPQRIAAHPGVLPPSDICATGAGLLLVYPDAAALVGDTSLELLAHPQLGLIYSVHSFPPLGTTLVTSDGVLDLRANGRLEQHLDTVAGAYQPAMSVGAAIVIRDRQGQLHLRMGDKFSPLPLPEGQRFVAWRQRHGHLWLLTDRGLYRLDTASRQWLSVAGALDPGTLHLLVDGQSQTQLCQAPPATGNGLPAGPLDLFAGDGGGVARLFNAPLSEARLALDPDFGPKIAPEQASTVSWQVAGFPCEAVPGAVRLVTSGTGPAGRLDEFDGTRAHPESDYPWVFDMGGEIPARGDYELDFALVAEDGSGERQRLDSYHIEIHESIFLLIGKAVLRFWQEWRAATVVQQAVSAVVLLAALAATGWFAYRLHLRRKYLQVCIFISYRRSDARGWAQKLYKGLKQHFDRRLIFYDTESLEVGSRFPRRINAALMSARVVLVLIGREWTQVRNAEGELRLAMPGDFVAHEVRFALEQGKVVIPLLLDGASMPGRQDLPPALAALADWQAKAMAIEEAGFRSEVKALAEDLDRILNATDMSGPDTVQSLSQGTSD